MTDGGRWAGEDGKAPSSPVHGPPSDSVAVLEEFERAVELDVALGPEILFGHLDFDVRRDALALDLAVVRGQPARDRDEQVAAVAQFPDRVDGALAEGLLPDQLGAVAILEGAGQDLGAAGAALVHEDDHRLVGPLAPAALHGPGVALAVAVDLVENNPILEELAGDI